ncbi:MAG: ankyrin repeat domain-containing protein [Capsulimonadales bacterium]|nr:ankyrin repeat domain-containing protein [Capsulimonadales bacterium]
MPVHFRPILKMWGIPLLVGLLLGTVASLIHSTLNHLHRLYAGMPIREAILQRDRARVARILAEGVPPKDLCVIGHAPLVWAAQAGDPTLVRLFLRYGDSDPLDALDRVGDPESARLLLHAVPRWGHTPAEIRDAVTAGLTNASAYHRAEVCRVLLRAGANPNATDNFDHKTPLMAWANTDYPNDEPAATKKTLAVLIEYGADPKHRNPNGQSAWDRAKASGHSDRAKMLAALTTKR